MTDDAQVFWTEVPSCGVHGPMKYRFKMCLWTCPGWDGEGCDDTPDVTDEERYYRSLGTAEPGSFAPGSYGYDDGESPAEAFLRSRNITVRIDAATADAARDDRPGPPAPV
jgi:hypothetical protein